MAISIKRYVDIKTTVSPSTSVARKEMIGRFYTSSDKLETGAVLEFQNLSGVSAVFGTSGAEYIAASKYFAYMSRTRISPDKISFANYNPSGRKCKLTPTKTPPALATLTAITDGSMKVSLGGVASDITSLDFSAAVDLAGCAAIIQAAIRAVNANGEQWVGATVEYVANVGFVLTGGAVGAAQVGYASAAASGTDISAIIKWDEASAPVLSSGAVVETPVECLTRTIADNANFGSFAFIDQLSSADIGNVAAWNEALGVEYLFSVGIDDTNLSAITAAVSGRNGTCLTYGASDNNCAYMPMAIMAATNYSVLNGSVNYMFTQFPNESASVNSDTKADSLDAAKVNYYGQTQNYAQKISFYQRGYMQGEISDISVYANEVWLRSACQTEIISLLLARNAIPANNSGAGLLRSTLHNVIEEALLNGTIMPGKSLSNTQQSVVLEMAGTEDAIVQIEQQGYWLDIKVVQVTLNQVQEYHLQYTLVYSKGDTIRKVVGYDVVM